MNVPPGDSFDDENHIRTGGRNSILHHRALYLSNYKMPGVKQESTFYSDDRISSFLLKGKNETNESIAWSADSSGSVTSFLKHPGTCYGPMDWRNEDSDYSSVENFMWEDKNSLAKSRSDQSIPGGCNVCNQGVQVALGGCRESRSFTSAFDRLELGAGAGSKENMLTLTETQDAQTCPCAGCVEHNASVTGFRTREISSLRLVIQGPEILNYQGTRQAPEDVAPYWKKDSRMWLWKSVRLARRKRMKPKSPAVLRSWSHEQEPIK